MGFVLEWQNRKARPSLEEQGLFLIIKFIYMAAMVFGPLKTLYHFLTKTSSSGILFIMIANSFPQEDGSQYIT